jgi:hypothetical protein
MKTEPEIPTPDYEDAKELWAFFGLTFYNAQVMEQGLVNLAVGLYAARDPRITLDTVQGLFSTMDSKTFGSVLRAAREVVSIPSGLDADLSQALDVRNRLAHRFFVEHDADLLSDASRRRMIDELRGYLLFFKRVDPELDKLWHAAWAKLGVTETIIQEAFRQLKSDASRGQTA